jgi:hypothetical protein
MWFPPGVCGWEGYGNRFCFFVVQTVFVIVAAIVDLDQEAYFFASLPDQKQEYQPSVTAR